MWLAVALAAALVWAGLILLRGGFWRADQRLGSAPEPAAWPSLVAVIPARDEAESIGDVVRAHRAADYPGPFRVIVVDDGSSDGTGALAAEAGAEVVRAAPLAAGWTGKLAAVAEGVSRAGAPDWLLLTDADIVLAPGTLRRLVAKGEAGGLALVSLMARLDARGFWGGLLMPAFVFFFQKLYPFPLVNDPRARTAGAAGGCMLVRRAALEAAGGIAAIRGALIDDCALGAALKRRGPVWLGLADREAVSLRDNRAFGSVWRMVRRTAFTQLRRSWLLLAGTVAGMALTYLAGPLAVLALPWHGDLAAALLGAGAWGAMVWAEAPTLRLYGKPAWWGLALPGVAAVYSAATIASALAHARGRGGQWKGRFHA